MFGATADRSRCLQNEEKSRCTFRTNVQCLDSFREYHANADSNTSKLFLFTPAPPPPPTELQNIAGNIKKQNVEDWSLSLISGRGRVGSEDFVPQMTPPFKIFRPLPPPPPLPTPRRSMITTRTLLKNKILKNREKKKIIQQSLPAETLVVFDGVTMSAYGRPK